MRPQPKLTLDQVIEIAAEFLSGAVSIKALAERNGVTRCTIRRALSGAGGYAEFRRFLPTSRLDAMLAYRCGIKGAKLALKEVVRIRQRFHQGATIRELSDYYGVSGEQIRRVVNGESHRMAGGPVYRSGKEREAE
jgi:hypothetical protein